MKEQVIANRGPRTSRSAAAQPRGFVQRPARRDGTAGGKARTFSPRVLFGYVPSALKFVLVILALVTLFVGYRVAASASLFQVRRVDVTGTSRISPAEIEVLTRRAAAKTGVWRADLSAISSELQRLPGIRSAVVTRVLPDGLRVRVTERVPVAVVRTSAGHFLWVDEEGVALGEMKNTDSVPSFFIRGWNEDGTEEARKDNAEKVQKYSEVAREWGALGLSERVSEVNLLDLQDVRAQLAGNDSQIEVRLHGQDWGERLKQALEALDNYRHTSGGSSITYIDSQAGRIVFGTTSGSKVSTTSEAPEPDATNPDTSPTTASTVKPVVTTKPIRSPLPGAQKPASNNAGRDGKPANPSRIRMR
jgi:cell division septal protein FtsQ